MEVEDLAVAERLGVTLPELHSMAADDVDRWLGYLDGISVARHEEQASAEDGNGHGNSPAQNRDRRRG